MMPRLIIRQELGMLSISSTYARLQPKRVRMEMQASATPVQMQGAGKLAKVRIDQTEAFASAGNKPILRMASDAANTALQDGLAAIERIASDGLAFMQSAQVGGGNPSAQLAQQAITNDIDRARVTVRSMPSVGPQIDVEGGDLQLDITPGSLNIQWNPVTHSEAEFTPGGIEVNWAVKPNIEITLDPGTEFMFPVPTGLGLSVDEAT